MKKHILWFLWYFHRPKSIRKVARKYNPWTEYTLCTTGQKARLTSIFENGEVSCFCWYKELPTGLGYGVFGIDPKDLIVQPTTHVEREE